VGEPSLKLLSGRFAKQFEEAQSSPRANFNTLIGENGDAKRFLQVRFYGSD